MKLLIDKKSNIQISEQIKLQLKYQIINKELPAGSKLPSVRDMSSFLNVNRHTISKAYKELEEEGLLQVKKYLGTFIAENIRSIEEKDTKELFDIINKAIKESNQVGFDTEEFVKMTELIYINSKRDKSKEIRGLVIECNNLAVKQYVRDLEKELEIDIEGCLISDIENGIMTQNKLEKYDIIMTTFGHYPSVKEMIENSENLYAINFGPYLKVLNKIGEYPKESNIGIVCSSETGSIGLKEILKNLGVIEGEIHQMSTINLQKVKEMESLVDFLVVSKYAYEENKDFFDTLQIDIIEYSNVLEETSTRMLLEVLDNIKSSTNQEGRN